MKASMHRLAPGVAAIAAIITLGACKDVLEVDFPGQIPTAQINDPSLAPVLVRSAIGDFECAYSNYMSGSALTKSVVTGRVAGANAAVASLTGATA